MKKAKFRKAAGIACLLFAGFIVIVLVIDVISGFSHPIGSYGKAIFGFFVAISFAIKLLSPQPGKGVDNAS